MEPSATERKRPRFEAAQTGHQSGEFRFSEVPDENLPVPPAAVFEHAFDEPGCVPLRVNGGPIHIPEQVVRQGGHGGILFTVKAEAKNEGAGPPELPPCFGV